jgi:hypothetical protein
MSNPEPLQITVNLDALLGELQFSLQTTINLLAISLRATPPKSMDDLRLPQEVFGTMFAQSARWSHAEALEKHQTWAIANGLRDAVEGVSSFIESAHKVLSIWELASTNGGHVTYGEYQAAMEGSAFHRLGLPDKLTHLKSEHGIAIDATLERQVLSVNNARNCLVHRQGVVSLRDLNAPDAMVVEWRKLHIFLQDEDGEHELVLGKVIEKASTVCILVRDEQKAFALGERVSFAIQEFADTTWGLHAFGTEIVRLVGEADPNKNASTPAGSEG